jgi:UDP-N-acetylglucosamine--N-acetylmuramyl-(pentapeptide) pyrophosphoryl-undecaprenol N-acetylglucosamine transferase
MKILMATGGTGGHIYPALVTADALKGRGWQVVFIGRFGSVAEKIRARGFECLDIPMQGFVSRGPIQVVMAGFGMIKAFFVCLGQVRKERPDVVIGFGSYSSFPTVLAGWLLGRSTIIHEQNAIPGVANKFLGKLVSRVALTFRVAASSFPAAKTVWTGCPLRSLTPTRDRASIIRSFGLEEGRKTLLVFGGSQGARVINENVSDMMAHLPDSTPWQIIHIAGRSGADTLRECYSQLSFPFFVCEYWENMAEAYAVADIVIGRAGAGTVTELGLLGIPAVLVPYPYAKNHQIDNARILVQLKTVLIILEKDLKPGMLRDKIFSIIEEGLSREKNRKKLKEDFAVDAADRLVTEIESLITAGS